MVRFLIQEARPFYPPFLFELPEANRPKKEADRSQKEPTFKKVKREQESSTKLQTVAKEGKKDNKGEERVLTITIGNE